jgi:hypothetical protein
MEGGQFKSGSTPDEIVSRMLQQVNRVTPQVADTVMGTYKSIHALVHAFRAGGPEILADLQVLPLSI